jgi:hypothetical protein
MNFKCIPNVPDHPFGMHLDYSWIQPVLLARNSGRIMDAAKVQATVLKMLDDQRVAVNAFCAEYEAWQVYIFPLSLYP